MGGKSSSLSRVPEASGLSSVGNFLDKCGKILGWGCAIVCVIVIAILIYMAVKTSKEVTNAYDNSVSVAATVTQVVNNVCNVSQVTNRKRGMIGSRTYTTNNIYDCNLMVSYTVNNKEFTNSLHTNDVNYKVGDKVNILVKQNDPMTINYSDDINKKNSSYKVYMGTAICLAVLTVIHIVLMKKSETYRGIVCINQFINLFN